MMTDQGEPRSEGMGQKPDDLPQMDGSCDACEPDEAQPATQLCDICSFAFCPVHAAGHELRTHHPLALYNHEGKQTQRLGMDRSSGGDAGPDAEAEAEAEPGGGAGAGAGAGAVMGMGMGMEIKIGELNLNEEALVQDTGEDRTARTGVAEERGEAEGKGGLPSEAERSERAEGAAEAAAEPAAEPGKREVVTVERLRCGMHGQEGSLYCKTDEQIICVVCAVQGDHRDHEIITLHEAYQWQKNREGYDLLGCTHQMGEKIKSKWNDPAMSPDELETYVNSQFEELIRLVHLEEKRTFHLVDLKEAFLTASAAEKIAEITVQTERLQEEMASITYQLGLLDQAEGAASAELLNGPPGHAPDPGARLPLDMEARPRLPEPRRGPADPRDLEDDEPGSSMRHAP